MAVEKLHQILSLDGKIKLDDIKEILYELKNDCISKSYNENMWEAGFYNGEGNAFYICLDLLNKLDVTSNVIRPTNVEDLILEGICDDCDQEPADCYNKDYCIYEKEKKKK